ncbi:4Fe-4S dicluster domain-containing protein [Desulfitobacterium sp.]|uniref:4Fe-4S dicluster domain-containing protein n=1 Tax=Desulfitobacterium sp. TaxID=49981 RepID=UPI002B1FF652|nr:4Fe-4S dicluster domain-containing protein [Desulfitobacterium sp.]MEA4900342.1 4Fe-4S dicluster domain-containing protein [Desulfitobacterium sp.]
MPEKNLHYGMVIDLRRCIGCHACTVTCKMENSIPEGFFRSWVVEADKGTYPDVTRVKLPRLCNQCESAPCEHVCPVKATHRDAGGVVVINGEKCIGCRYCISACPYDARFLNPKTGTAEKCDLCLKRVQAGLMPACVSSCVAHARFFGDLNDPQSEVAKLLSENSCQVLRPELGTKPSVYYIGLDEAIAGADYANLFKRR